MTAGAEIDLDIRLAGLIGQSVAEAMQSLRGEGELIKRRYPRGTVQTDTTAVPLTTGAPVLGNSKGPLLGWAWRVWRLQIVAATAGTYTVYRDRGLGPQDQIIPPNGITIWNPNGTYEPGNMWVRYPYAFNAVGAAVTSAGILVIDYLNIREDWLPEACA